MAKGREEDTHWSDTSNHGADENSFDSGMGRSVLILPDAPISSTSHSMVTGLSIKIDHLDLQSAHVHVPDTPSVALESVHSSDTPPQPHPNIDVFKRSHDEDIRALNADVEKLRKDYQQLKEELENVQGANNTVISNQKATIEQLQNKIAEQEQQNAKLKQAEKNKDFDDIKSMYLQMKRLFEECKIDIDLLKQKVNANASESSQESNSRDTTNHEDGYTQYEADFNSSHLGIGKGKHLKYRIL